MRSLQPTSRRYADPCWHIDGCQAEASSGLGRSTAVSESAAAQLKYPRRIAFSHAFSELLVVKSVRAYADQRALELGGLELIHGTTKNGDLAHQLAEVSA